jgi:hypothetical protein
MLHQKSESGDAGKGCYPRNCLRKGRAVSQWRRGFANEISGCIAACLSVEGGVGPQETNHWSGRGIHPKPARSKGNRYMTDRSTSADFVTAFSTGWPEREPHLLVLSLTTHRGVQDFAMTREQALLIAKTIKRSAGQLAQPKKVG